jgi:cytochrome b6-f complex iron-sulfur subunit
MDEREKSRRDFLRNGWKLGGALLIGAGVYTGYEALRPLTTGATGAKITVGDVANFPAGTSTYVPAGRMYVVNASNHLFALSQKCPHLGCRVPFCDSSGRFECPCHGSIYDLAGEYIAGPAPTGMDRYDLSLAGRNVVVDTSKLHTGPDRGVHTFLTPAKGPSCLGKA